MGSSKPDPVSELDEIMKETRLDLGVQKIPQDELLNPDEFFTKTAPANIHLNETFPWNSDCNDSDYFEEATYKETNGLKCRQTFQTAKENISFKRRKNTKR